MTNGGVDLSIITPWTDRYHFAPAFRVMSRAIASAMKDAGFGLEWIVIGYGELPGPFAKRLYPPNAKSLKDIGELRRWGVKFSTGTFVAFVDSDDWHDPDRFLTALTILTDEMRIKAKYAPDYKPLEYAWHVNDAQADIRTGRFKRYMHFQKPHLLNIVARRYLFRNVAWPKSKPVTDNIGRQSNGAKDCDWLVTRLAIKDAKGIRLDLSTAAAVYVVHGQNTVPYVTREWPEPIDRLPLRAQQHMERIRSCVDSKLNNMLETRKRFRE